MSAADLAAPIAAEALPSAGTVACSQCGGPVEAFDRFCPSCGHEQAVAAQAAPAGPQRRFRCENCGAEVAVEPQQRSYTCAFCDSNYVIEVATADTGRQPPEFVIGFSVALAQAQERFRQWLGASSWFRPSDLAAAQIVEKLRGVYVPFWSFTMLAESRWSAAIGEYWYRTETYTTTENGKTVTKTRTVRETEWWNLSGGHHNYHSGYLVSGSRGLAQRDAERIKPYHLAALKRYEPLFLAGWLSEEYSVEREEALRLCQAEFQRRQQQDIAAHLPGDTHSNLQVETSFSDITSDLILLPVYLLSYRYRDKVYRFMMNGQTGKVAGQKPLSGWRIAIAVGLGVLVVLVLWLIFAAL